MFLIRLLTIICLILICLPNIGFSALKPKYDPILGKMRDYNSYTADTLGGQTSSYFAIKADVIASTTSLELNKVPYVGAHSDVDIGTHTITARQYNVVDSSTNITRDASNTVIFNHNVNAWNSGSALNNSDGTAGRYVQISSPTASNFSIPGNWSVICKANVSFASGNRIIFSRYNGSLFQYYLYAVNAFLVFSTSNFGYGANDIYFANTMTPLYDKDAYYAVVVDSNTLGIYVNGTLIKPFQTIKWTGQTDGRLYLGASSAGNAMKGTFDEVKFYNVTLTTAQVQNICSSGSGAYGMPSDSGLVAGYHLDEGAGTFIDDFGASKNTGTVVGALSWTTGLVKNPTSLISTNINIIKQTDGDQIQNSYTIIGDTNSFLNLKGAGVAFFSSSNVSNTNIDNIGLNTDNINNRYSISSTTMTVGSAANNSGKLSVIGDKGNAGVLDIYNLLGQNVISLQSNNGTYGALIQFPQASGGFDMFNYRFFGADGAYGYRYQTKGASGYGINRFKISGNVAMAEVSVSSSNFSVDGNVNFTGVIATTTISGGIDVQGVTRIRMPYATFYSTTTQSIAVVNTTQTITLDGSFDAHDIELVNNCIVPTYSGEYHVVISVIADGDQGKFIYIFPRINGINVPYSNTNKKFAANQTADIIAVAYNFELNAGDRLEYIMVSDDVDTEIIASKGFTTPVMPDVPSIIITVNKTGEIQ